MKRLVGYRWGTRENVPQVGEQTQNQIGLPHYIQE